MILKGNSTNLRLTEQLACVIGSSPTKILTKKHCSEVGVAQVHKFDTKKYAIEHAAEASSPWP